MTSFDESGWLWLTIWLSTLSCCYADHSQLSQALLLTEVESFRSVSNKTAPHWFMCFIKNKLSCILCSFDVILYFHCQYFISSWNQISFLYLEWFQMFVIDTVLYMYIWNLLADIYETPCLNVIPTEDLQIVMLCNYVPSALPCELLNLI
jgi:hypothetical protein